jgi:hypothetical protein
VTGKSENCKDGVMTRYDMDDDEVKELRRLRGDWVDTRCNARAWLLVCMYVYI